MHFPPLTKRIHTSSFYWHAMYTYCDNVNEVHNTRIWETHCAYVNRSAYRSPPLTHLLMLSPLLLLPPSPSSSPNSQSFHSLEHQMKAEFMWNSKQTNDPTKNDNLHRVTQHAHAPHPSWGRKHMFISKYVHTYRSIYTSIGLSSLARSFPLCQCLIESAHFYSVSYFELLLLFYCFDGVFFFIFCAPYSNLFVCLTAEKERAQKRFLIVFGMLTQRDTMYYKQYIDNSTK